MEDAANIKVEQKVDVDELFRAFKNEIEGGGGAGDKKVKNDPEPDDAPSVQVKTETSDEKPVEPSTSDEAEAKEDPLLSEFYSEVSSYLSLSHLSFSQLSN